MSDEIERRAEEVSVTRVPDEAALKKQSAEFVNSLVQRPLPVDPEEQLDEVTARMRRVLVSNAKFIDRKQKAEVVQTLSTMVLKAQTLSIAAHTRHIENVLRVTEDQQKRRLMEQWIDFINTEGARVVTKLNRFIADWMKYSQTEIEKARTSGLTPEREKKLMQIISDNENRMVDDVLQMVQAFQQQNKKQEDMIREVIR